MRWLWLVLGALVLVETIYELLGLRGADALVNDWVHNGLLLAAAGTCLVRVVARADARVAWLLVGLGLLSWAAGDVIWTALYGGDESPPAASVVDAFWLAWYPLAIVGLGLLAAHRVPHFELHRWIDGVAVMLLLAIPWVGLILEPVAEHSAIEGGAEVVNLLYPLADMLLLGALLGVFALMAWKLAGPWPYLAAGIVLITIGDAIYAVEILESAYRPGVYDFFWPAGAVLVAYAAWRPSPDKLPHVPVTGWRAIALPVAAQVVAAGVQISALFRELPESERVLTVLVIVIAMVQIVISRPRVTHGGARR
jgi:hypothetical protein